jgi:hypothetical protein
MEIDEIDIERAIRLVDYFKSHARRVHRRLDGRFGGLDEHARAILGWIVRRGEDQFRFAELWDDLSGRFRDQDECYGALDKLVSRGFIRLIEVESKAKGRKLKATYQVHPELLHRQAPEKPDKPDQFGAQSPEAA